MAEKKRRRRKGKDAESQKNQKNNGVSEATAIDKSIVKENEDQIESDFTLEPDLLKVGNVAANGIVSDIPQHEFAGLTEIYERKVFRIRARNKVDAEKLLAENLQSQDKIVGKIQGVSGGYKAEIDKFIGRNF